VLIGLEEGGVRQIAEQLEGGTGRREAFYLRLGRDGRYHGMKGTNALALWEEVIWEAYEEGRPWFSVGRQQ
jgi:hypothetical protein